MKALAPQIKGWCPSVLRPMESGDGLLVRLHVSGGALDAGTARAIAGLARKSGNGLIDLTQKGNLQLRGVSAETLPALTARLRELKLVEASASSRHVIGPPLAGLDETASIDGAALVRELETKLAVASDLQVLPDKFCFLVDEGGRLGLDRITADVRLIGIKASDPKAGTGFGINPMRSKSANGRVLLALASAHGCFVPIALTGQSQAADAAMALARAFHKLSRSVAARRMDQLVQTAGAVAVAEAAGLTFDASLPVLPLRITDAQDVIGSHEGFIGLAAPFGRLHAGQLEKLAAIAQGGLRLTPWRTILLPGRTAEQPATLEDLGLIASPDDARLAIVACPGQPACRSAQIDTRGAAQVLAPLARQLMPEGRALHISGCSKGCASAAPSPITLVGHNGLYELVADGRADGVPIARGLDLQQVLTALVETSAGHIRL